MQIENIWCYKADYWKNQMLNAIYKEDVAIEYSGIALRAFCEATEHFQGAKLRTILKEIGKHARYMVQPSDCIRDGYRLTEDWIRIIIAQLSIHGSQGDDKIYGMISRLWESLGWDAEKSINPTGCDTDRTIPFSFDNDGEIIKFNIVLEPTTEFPYNAQYISSKGKVYNHVENTNDHHMLSANDGSGWTFPVTSDALRGMKRIK